MSKRNILLLFLSLSILFSCAQKKNKLYIFNWAYYIPEEVIEKFKEKYKIEVVYDVFTSNEELYAKLKAGGSGYDIVFPSADYASIMIKENMLEKLDKSKLTILGYIDPELTKKMIYDINMDYSIPFMAGAAGIAVNKKYVKNYPKNFSIYEMSELKGRMTLLDEIREVFGAALMKLGYSVNSTNKKELLEAKELILKWKKNIQKFDSEAFAKGFASGEFWVVHGYGENVFLEIDESDKENIDFFIPENGGPMYIDNMVILKDAKNKDNAYKFINFIHSPEIYAEICDYLSLPSLNIKARDYMKTKPLFTFDALQKCELQLDIGENIELYNTLWNELKLEK